MNAPLALEPNQPMWQPGAERIAAAHVTVFRQFVNQRHGLQLADYEALWQWSIRNLGDFWSAVWDSSDVKAEHRGVQAYVPAESMPDARFFPDARLNFAQNLLRRKDDLPAILFWGEDKVRRDLSWRQLHAEVSRMQQWLAAQGVGPGDRVAAYLPNLPEAVITMLAASSLGAVFTSASPDFGAQGLIDRFGQVQPKVLVACDGYFYAGKTVDVRDKLAEAVPRLQGLQAVLIVPYVAQAMGLPADLSAIPRARLWAEALAPFAGGEVRFVQLPFDHPLYILYSSGTTGVPKCIVHRAGGVLLKHLSEMRLHADVHTGDRVFYFTTCGWMMWNWMASGLASGATLLLYDGSPFAGHGKVLFDYAQAERMTHFGTSAKFIDAAAKIGLSPRDSHDLSPLRVLFSTGSPLSPEGFDWVYREVKADLLLASISGGTDIVSCFVLGNPVLPVYRGEIQCRGLGMAVAVFDEEGRPLQGAKGELVCVRPFPVMPVGFWNDPDGKKYHAAYFERFPGVWCHGDYCELTPRGGVIIYGRSDATLNPGGVRIGTAEIYRQVEQLPEVLESIVIGQDWPPGRHDDVRVVLFVKLQPGLALDRALEDRIRAQIRANTTPRHVPAKIVQVPDIPRTKSGKIVELAVRNMVHSQPVKNLDALANPEALDYFRDLAVLAD